mmetsp:Transcript_7366/g.20964  ORF Transcript_7366/g.20964 Transcript_7366/m.20964 type:complete len:245 (+) Transcript_7366:682-1416(+)
MRLRTSRNNRRRSSIKNAHSSASAFSTQYRTMHPSPPGGVRANVDCSPTPSRVCRIVSTARWTAPSLSSTRSARSITPTVSSASREETQRVHPPPTSSGQKFSLPPIAPAAWRRSTTRRWVCNESATLTVLARDSPRSPGGTSALSVNTKFATDAVSISAPRSSSSTSFSSCVPRRSRSRRTRVCGAARGGSGSSSSPASDGRLAHASHCSHAPTLVSWAATHHTASALFSAATSVTSPRAISN